MPSTPGWGRNASWQSFWTGLMTPVLLRSSSNLTLKLKATGKVFHMCWPLSDGSSKFIPIDEQPNHQIVHAFRLGKAQRATHQPLDPGPEIDVLALACLRVLLASMMGLQALLAENLR